MRGGFLVIVVLKSMDVLITLLLLCSPVSNSYFSGCLFHGAIGKQLLSAHVLQLQSFKTILFLVSVFQKLLLANLLSALMQNSILLLLVQALEMVRFDTVSRQHRLFSGGVLGHQVMRKGELLFGGSIVLQVLVMFGIAATLFFGELLVGGLGSFEHSRARGVMIILSFLKKSMVCQRILVVVHVAFTFVLSVELLFTHLLFNPVFLL